MIVKTKFIENVKVGHCTDVQNGTGVTAILFEDGAVGGCCVRGCAPGTRETDLLKNDKAVDKINAVVLSGGSAFGLESMTGVMEFLFEKGKGLAVGKNIVPIVCGAVLYDLDYKKFAYPNKESGKNACKNASATAYEFGNVGAGTGATLGKILADKSSTKGGLGISTICVNGVEMVAVVAVNALGDVYDAKSGQIIAGAKANDGSFLNTNKLLLTDKNASEKANEMFGRNTTIGCVFTNAKLTKVEANKLAKYAQNGLAISIKPCQTDFDGDSMFAVSCGDADCDMLTLQAMCIEVVCDAIKKAVA